MSYPCKRKVGEKRVSRVARRDWNILNCETDTENTKAARVREIVDGVIIKRFLRKGEFGLDVIPNSQANLLMMFAAYYREELEQRPSRNSMIIADNAFDLYYRNKYGDDFPWFVDK